MNQQHAAQETPLSQDWARQALWLARDPFIEFIHQDAVARPMLALDQQPKLERSLRKLADLVYTFPSTIADPHYNEVAEELYDKTHPHAPPGHRNRRKVEIGSNAFDPFRQLMIGTLLPLPVLKQATHFKEALNTHQRFVQTGKNFGKRDTRTVGMLRTLRESREVDDCYGGYGGGTTGAITEDRDFIDFMKGASLAERGAEEPDMKDLEAVRSYMRKKPGGE